MRKYWSSGVCAKATGPPTASKKSRQGKNRFIAVNLTAARGAWQRKRPPCDGCSEWLSPVEISRGTARSRKRPRYRFCDILVLVGFFFSEKLPAFLHDRVHG